MTDYSPNGQPTHAAFDSDKFNLRTLFFLFLRNWYWLAIGLALGLFGAWVHLRYATTIYEVKGSVLINEDAQQPISEQIIARDLGFQGRSTITNDLQVLKSSTLMQRVVDSLDLHISYYTEGRIKTSEMYPYSPFRLEADSMPQAYGRTLRIRTLDNDDFVLLRGEGDTLLCRFGIPFTHAGVQFTLELLPGREVRPGVTHQIKVRQPQQTARKYAGKLNLTNVDYSNVLNISMREPVPEKAVDVIKGIIQAYDESIVENKNRSGEQTLAFIDERLNFITQELYDVEKDVEGFRRDRDLPVDVGERAGNYLAQVQQVEDQLMELDLKLALLDNIEGIISDKANQYQPLPLTSEILPAALSTLLQEYNSVLFEREQFLEAATAQNPAVNTYEERLDYLRSGIELSIRTVRSELAERRGALRERLRPLEEQISSIPGSERELLQIMRQQQIKEQLFLYLLQKREETALSIAAQTSNSRILNPPTNAGQVYPSPGRVYLFALVLGLLLPGGLIFLWHSFDNKIYTKEHLQQATNAPFLGSISLASKRDPVAVKSGSRSAVAELFRLLRTNLNYLAGGKGDQVILVTSSVSGEGKSFVTINLGLSLALSGRRVLLLGMDLRKPKLSEYLNGQRSPLGVTNYLAGEDTLDALLRPVPGYDHIDYLDCGPIPPNPADLLTSDRVDQLFADLRDRYDHILVDTSPLGLVTDALLLGEQANLSIIVTRYGRTTFQLLEGVQDVYAKKKLPNMGIVLNGIRASSIYGYGGYGFGYGYGYGEGYYEEERKPKRWRIF